MGIKSYVFEFDVPVIHVGMLVGEVSLLGKLYDPLLHKHITRASMTYTTWLN